MKDSLFNEFNQVSAKQWKQKIQVDLKGADYNDTLLWKTNDGIEVKPFYHHDEVEQLSLTSHKNNVAICQSIFVSDEKTANFLAKDALKRGATAIQFEANEPFDVDMLLRNVIVSETKQSVEIHFKLNFLSEKFLLDLINKTPQYDIYLNIDPIGNLAKTGNWFYNQKEDHQILDNILNKATENTTILSVDASIYQNAGATTVQQVAYALAHANEYLNYLKNSNVTLSAVEGSFQFHFSVGSNYFFEIAKLRAFRVLWQTLLDEYNLSPEASGESHIFITPSLRNKTLYDYNINMLRTTTECMSAILGGADTISNIAYDSIYHKKNEFGERIARNQLLILQEESYFKKASHFADGSYYIETLTKQIAEKALTIFKEIEKSGGFLKQLQEGTIQRKIKESAQKEQTDFDNEDEVLLGTNKHPNANDKMKDELELYPFVKMKPRKTLIKPIIPKRLAEKFEQERLGKE
ncbi:MAG: methylmalonyl-CoA mutase subunit beta [Flavobacteriaceae bacterium]|nr:methylmalonyl-CoA mutase subunit beta [Flavobacteriaceae bacterium]